MKEIEVRGYIKKEDFDKKIEELTLKFGKAKIKRRLSLTLGAYDAFDLETKIRITNGVISITQKYGDQNDVSREELEMSDVKLTAEHVLQLYQIFKAYQGRISKEIYAVAIQHENYLFYTPDKSFELKLFRQFKSESEEFFAFELEQMAQSSKSIDEMLAELGLEIASDYNSPQTVIERNEKYNIQINSLENGELLDLIQKYLDSSANS